MNEPRDTAQPSLETERRDHTIKALARLIARKPDDDLRGLIGFMGWNGVQEIEAALRYVLDAGLRAEAIVTYRRDLVERVKALPGSYMVEPPRDRPDLIDREAVIRLIEEDR